MFFVDIVPNYGCICASILFHKIMLGRIIQSPLSFFDTTPIGRILARFSSDLTVTDSTIPSQVASFIYFGFQVNSHY